MKKSNLPKIIVITFTVALVTGILGGALTNEYLVAYLFDQLSEKQEEKFPIVKKVIEEKVYLEESSTIEAIDTASKALVLVSETSQIKNASLSTSGMVLTSDGIIVTCSSFVEDRNSWFIIMDDGQTYSARVVYHDKNDDIAFLQITDKNQFKYFDTLKFNSEPLKTGQKILSIGAFNKAKSGIVSYITKFPTESIISDYEIDSNFACGPSVNMNGEFIGITLDSDSIEQGKSHIIPAPAINNALNTFKTTLQ